MSKLAAVLSNRAYPVRRNLSDHFESWKDRMADRLIDYFEGFARRVDNDTLTFREGFTIFLGGGLVVQLFIWLGSLFQ